MKSVLKNNINLMPIWYQNALNKFKRYYCLTIPKYIPNVPKKRELMQTLVVKNYFTTSAAGKEYNITFYALEDNIRNSTNK